MSSGRLERVRIICNASYGNMVWHSTESLMTNDSKIQMRWKCDEYICSLWNSRLLLSHCMSERDRKEREREREQVSLVQRKKCLGVQIQMCHDAISSCVCVCCAWYKYRSNGFMPQSAPIASQSKDIYTFDLNSCEKTCIYVWRFCMENLWI